MAFLIICNDRDLSPWVKALKDVKPDLDVRIYPDEGNLEEVEFVLCWKHPKGVLKKYPNLKAISSLGAGVDHLFTDPDLPTDVALARIVDPELAQGMSEFVIGIILNQMRSFITYHENQKQKLWKAKRFPIAKNTQVGVMGLGVLGQDLAKKLIALGFKVAGWAQSPKNLSNVKVFLGEDELKGFLSETNILVCLLPLTDETEIILNNENFSRLPENSYLINVARGEHLVEKDLIEMIGTGHLAGATLDVFREEPLPVNHAFWNHPKIKITPHIASLTNPASVAPQLIENYERARSGKELLNQVSAKQGY